MKIINLIEKNWFKVSLLIIVFSIEFSIETSIVLAHPGRTDAYGCHTCRTNCSSWGLSYGEYHCHRAKALPQPKSPVKSKFGEGGTGYTQPAPEYKSPTILKPKITEQPKPPIVQSVEPHPQKGFWQWLFGLFR